MAGVKGLEPSTYRVTGDRSNQLSYTPTCDSFWWAVKDSNLWPPRCKRDALPTELTAQNQITQVFTTFILRKQEMKKWALSTSVNILRRQCVDGFCLSNFVLRRSCVDESKFFTLKIKRVFLKKIKQLIKLKRNNYYD